MANPKPVETTKVEHGEDDHVSQRPSSVAEGVKAALGDGFSCCGCWVSGNGLSLLVAAVLFAAITGTQWIFAEIANSDALKADCVSMGVDVLAFLGNLFAECNPFPQSKRRLELAMSGISHILLMAFTILFLQEGYGDVTGPTGDDCDDRVVNGTSYITTTHDDDENGCGDDEVNGYIVLGFALGGLAFDLITLLTYKYYGTKKTDEELAMDNADAITCGINTNMCAALLHVISDLARSTTTFIESIVILTIPSVPSTYADGYSTLIVCGIILIGATGAILTWVREVYIYLVTPEVTSEVEARNSLMRSSIQRDEEEGDKDRASRASISSRPSAIADGVTNLAGKTWKCCGCVVSGNAISLLVAAVLFAAITATQWIFAEIANSDALKADCVSMGVDVLAFLGNLFAECNPFPDSKRRLELTMSGISHALLVGFTLQFVIDGYYDATDPGDDDGDVNGYIVLGFALGGLAFDLITLLTYNTFGAPKKDDLDPESAEDALTCGINTNMCAALLHVISDLARSTTTLIESIVILCVANINSTQADGVSTLIVCSIILIGGTGALLTWMREVYIFMNTKPDSANQADYRQLAHA